MAINLTASLLFLVAVSVVYGISGTLNMADLARRMAGLEVEDRALLEAGLAVLGVAFLLLARVTLRTMERKAREDGALTVKWQ